MDFVNLTRFAAERLVTMDESGAETLLVVVKATWDISGKQPTPAAEPDPVHMADEYLGDPATTSIRHGHDLALAKRVADVVLRGHAVPSRPGGREGEVTLRVGKLRKIVRVFGDRVWAKGLVANRMSDPSPFERMPLVFERAFGGGDASDGEAPERCAENPVGVGFRGKRSSRQGGGPLPNLENPAALIRSPGDRPSPAGFGFVGPHWAPRVNFGGTYDAAWARDRMPFLPADFDARFYQTAPADQMLDGYVRGGEAVEIDGVAPRGSIRLTVPGVHPEVVVRVGDQRLVPTCSCDTLVIDADRRVMSQVWRSRVPIQGRLAALQWVKVQLAGATR